MQKKGKTNYFACDDHLEHGLTGPFDENISESTRPVVVAVSQDNKNFSINDYEEEEPELCCAVIKRLFILLSKERTKFFRRTYINDR